ncbi:ELL-associated factor 2 [Galendromus occidentalis]|uniref:Ell-associated factor Eaf n=1 Tax=Galendromus occidentalis TaxID=34638 RepID=A0AAJ6QSB3_9ACAR|nr:ELL-associated factor 2 [Galendromus occidentalis]
MNNISIGDKLGLTGKAVELKLGKSFDSSASQNTPGFHTFRYDFKPASVDASQGARVDVEQRNQISVTVPHHDSTSSTTFRGSQRQYQKECVLIIDQRTGQLTLERLSCNVQLKKTRAEGSSKVSLGPPGRPLTPSVVNHGAQGVNQDLESAPNPAPRMKRPSPPMPHQRTHTPNAVKQRISPVGAPRQPVAKPVLQPMRPQQAALAANSMPMLLDDSGRFDDTGLNLQHVTLQAANATSSIVQNAHGSKNLAPSMPTFDSNTDVIEMSEGSSSSSSDSDSSSDGSDSESEEDTQRKKGPVPPQAPHMPPASDFAPTPTNRQSMPKLSQLSEDLQLSESGSDSD